MADTHLGFTSGRTSTARKYVYDSMFHAFERILTIAKMKKVDYVLHAGDLFNRSKPPKHVIGRAFESIRDLLENGIGFIVIPGNHDRSKFPETLLTYFYHNFIIFRKLEVIRLNDIGIIGFPFVRSNTNTAFQKAIHLSKKIKNTPVILLCHQIFSGSWFGPHKYYFFGKNAITIDKLPSNLKFIVTGHIHRAQAVQSNQVYYTGSTARSSFAEIIEPKGYLDIQIEDDYQKVDFCEIDSIPMKVIEIDLSNSNLSLGDIEERLPTAGTRTLLRLIGKKVVQNKLKDIFSYFDYEQWPLLSITPRSSEIQLQPLFSKYVDNGKFYFNKNG